jgi:23S rRNA G2445 N2-methylase RlmL
MTTYTAHTVRGIEDICLQELKDTLHISESQVLPKKIIFVNGQDVSLFKSLKTIDDISILVADFPYDRSQPFTKEQCEKIFDRLDFSEVRETIATQRELDNTFSITISAPLIKGMSQSEMSRVASVIIAKKTGWEFKEKERSHFDIRISIEEQEWYISVRLFEKPLHDRKQYNESKTAAVRPSLAAAMVRLVAMKPESKRLVDSFCGTGTILCEAHAVGYEVWGSDINPEAIVDAKLNLAVVGGNADQVFTQDATKTKWTDHYFDAVVSNLPWNEKVKVSSIQSLYKGIIKEYRRITNAGRTMVFLCKRSDLLIKMVKAEFPHATIEKREISINGQNPHLIVVRT